MNTIEDECIVVPIIDDDIVNVFVLYRGGIFFHDFYARFNHSYKYTEITNIENDYISEYITRGEIFTYDKKIIFELFNISTCDNKITLKQIYIDKYNYRDKYKVDYMKEYEKIQDRKHKINKLLTT